MLCEKRQRRYISYFGREGMRQRPASGGRESPDFCGNQRSIRGLTSPARRRNRSIPTTCSITVIRCGYALLVTPYEFPIVNSWPAVDIDIDIWQLVVRQSTILSLGISLGLGESFFTAIIPSQQEHRP